MEQITDDTISSFHGSRSSHRYALISGSVAYLTTLQTELFGRKSLRHRLECRRVSRGSGRPGSKLRAKEMLTYHLCGVEER